MNSREHGFTLVELLIVTLISGVVLGALGKIFISSNELYTVQRQVVDLQQGLRGAINMMASDIRMAGLNPTGNAANATMTTANATDVRMLMDYNASGSVTRDRHYRYDPGENKVLLQLGGGGGFQFLADDVESFSFSYQLSNGTTTQSPPDPGDVRSVIIDTCGQTSGAYSDEHNATYCFNREIMCRNMGL